MDTIVVAGAGAAGLSFAYFLSRSTTAEFSCILVDPDSKTDDDRTWAYWGPSFHFDFLTAGSWSHVDIRHHGKTTVRSSVRPGGPRRRKPYRFIRSSAFYETCKAQLAADPRFSFVRSRVEGYRREAAGVQVTIADRRDESVLHADYLIDTVFGPRFANAYCETRPTVERGGGAVQAFVGWEVRTTAPVWESEAATLMDLVSTDRRHALEFFYVLPMSTTRALVECTAVDRRHAEDDYLEDRLERYLNTTVGDGRWTILRREKGSIPLDLDVRPGASLDGAVIHAGVCAGAARPSTGYAFRSIVETSRAMADTYARFGAFTTRKGARVPRRAIPPHVRRRARFFDAVFLAVLSDEPDTLPDIFRRLFAGNPQHRVLRFLAARATILQEAAIILSLPWPPFLRALGRLIRRRGALAPAADVFPGPPVEDRA